MAEMTSGEMMRDWRRNAGLTQRQLARLACIARASISHIETGRYEPSPIFARRVARALGEHLGRTVNAWDVFPGQFHPLPETGGRPTAA